MNTPNTCTPQEAVMTYRFHETGTEAPVMVLDLDAATAAVCTVEKGCPAKTLWSYQGDAPQESFFRAAARALLPDHQEQEAADALRRGVGDWLSALWIYCRFPDKTLELEPLTVGGQTVKLRCAQLVQVFRDGYEPALRQMLKQASDYKKNMEQPRQLPLLLCGELATFFPAEFLVRRFFYSITQACMLVVPGMLRWKEDPLEAARKGEQLYEQLVNKQRSLEHTWTLKILRRTPEGVQNDTLILARKGTHPDQLRQVQYQEELLVAAGEELTVFIGSTVYRAPVPEVLLAGQSDGYIQVGLGMPEDQPLLYVRSGKLEAALRQDELKMTREAAT